MPFRLNALWLYSLQRLFFQHVFQLRDQSILVSLICFFLIYERIPQVAELRRNFRVIAKLMCDPKVAGSKFSRTRSAEPLLLSCFHRNRNGMVKGFCAAFCVRFVAHMTSGKKGEYKSEHNEHGEEDDTCFFHSFTPLFYHLTVPMIPYTLCFFQRYPVILNPAEIMQRGQCRLLFPVKTRSQRWRRGQSA